MKFQIQFYNTADGVFMKSEKPVYSIIMISGGWADIKNSAEKIFSTNKEYLSYSIKAINK